jgi:hypothetical protein
MMFQNFLIFEFGHVFSKQVTTYVAFSFNNKIWKVKKREKK